MKKSAKDILDRYVAAAQGHGEGTESGNFRLANRCYRHKVKALHELDSVSESGRATLLDLVGHDNPYVRLWAATDLLRTHTDSAISVLERLAQSPGIAGGEARATLEEWRKGTLWIP